MNKIDPPLAYMLMGTDISSDPFGIAPLDNECTAFGRMRIKDIQNQLISVSIVASEWSQTVLSMQKDDCPAAPQKPPALSPK